MVSSGMNFRDDDFVNADADATMLQFNDKNENCHRTVSAISVAKV